MCARGLDRDDDAVWGLRGFAVTHRGWQGLGSNAARIHGRNPSRCYTAGWRLSLVSSIHGWGEVMLAAKSFSAVIGARECVADAMRCLAALFVLIVLPSLAQAQETSPPQSRNGEEYTIRVSADSVVLHATVQNHNGALVAGLAKDNFQVYEDGVLQKIDYFSHEDIPVTVGLVIDNSGSMTPNRREVIDAALAFARSSNTMDQMFVVIFNEHVSFGLQDGTPFTDQVSQLEIALSRIDATGMTALYDAMAAAIDHLKQGNRDKKVLIVVSDGGDNASKHSLDQIKTLAGQSDAIIYTIDISIEEDPDRNPVALRQLAKNTGGESYLPTSIRGVLPICERIARDIRNQYTLAYTPTNRKQDGTYRAIHVKAGAPGRGRVIVRTRAGYNAPLKSEPIADNGPTRP
jgi:Ca-activated chloride channel homolog